MKTTCEMLSNRFCLASGTNCTAVIYIQLYIVLCVDDKHNKTENFYFSISLVYTLFSINFACVLSRKRVSRSCEKIQYIGFIMKKSIIYACFILALQVDLIPSDGVECCLAPSVLTVIFSSAVQGSSNESKFSRTIQYYSGDFPNKGYTSLPQARDLANFPGIPTCLGKYRKIMVCLSTPSVHQEGIDCNTFNIRHANYFNLILDMNISWHSFHLALSFPSNRSK